MGDVEDAPKEDMVFSDSVFGRFLFDPNLESPRWEKHTYKTLPRSGHLSCMLKLYEGLVPATTFDSELQPQFFSKELYSTFSTEIENITKNTCPVEAGHIAVNIGKKSRTDKSLWASLSRLLKSCESNKNQVGGEGTWWSLSLPPSKRKIAFVLKSASCHTKRQQSTTWGSNR